MSVTVPDPIQPLLEMYVGLVEQTLPGFMEGLYLHGSIALGAFNQRFSDIDFITVGSRRCTDDDVEQLRVVHKKIASAYPQWELNGSYFQWSDLGKFEETVLPHSYHHDGVLYPSGHYEANPVTWWVLKQHGLALLGPHPRALDFAVDWDVLIAGMRQNLNTYWVTFTRHPRRMTWLFVDDGVQWAVLGVLRQFYTFREGDITSKTGAGEYALAHLPVRWHRLVREAIRLQEQGGPSLYASRVARAAEAVRFLRYIIQECNALLRQ